MAAKPFGGVMTTVFGKAYGARISLKYASNPTADYPAAPSKNIQNKPSSLWNPILEPTPTGTIVAIAYPPHRNDSHLHGCIQNFATLRLLSQPFGETLLAFLCSATKQIPQIKVMCENLANTLGSEIISGIHALPSWIQVASASEENLRSLSLGFRAKNIKRTADVIAKNPNLLFQIENAPYPEAKEQLMALPGVGSKIADCALLFGAGKLEAFPVDTWIIKAMEKRYNLNGWKPQQIEHFGRVHFGPLAGYAQQFLFSWERINR